MGKKIMKIRFSHISKSEFVLLGIMLCYSVGVGIVNPAFLNIDSFFDIIRFSSSTLIIAMGLFVVMLSGGIDISFMAIALFGSYTATKILLSLNISNIVIAFGISMSIGLILGLFNAWLISWLKLPTFIITLGTQNLFHGIMACFIGAKTYGAGLLPESFSKFGSATLFLIHTKNGTVGLTSSVLIVAAVVFATWFLIYKTIIGREIVALGNSEDAARRAGFNPLFLRLIAYGYMGILAGCAGVVYVCQVNAVYPDKLVGDELMVIAGAVIGGTSITGGKGKILGVILGILLIYLFNSTLIFLGLTSSWNKLAVGSVLTIAASITSLRTLLKNKQQLIFSFER
ncbi:ABC transporter permease [Treponema socranskii]|uniref:ABC transporter permease n=1 Tax=Treponema TaxID=157 RepID=UPI0028726BB6|nr:ABC transporter permease [Treponema socranskii]MDR9859048.1 ABC transporter permease [Treponema socranskii]